MAKLKAVNGHLESLHDLIRAQCSPAAWDWFEQALHHLEQNAGNHDQLSLFLAQARRKMGAEGLKEISLETSDGRVDLGGMQLGQVARMALMLQGVSPLDAGEKPALLESCYRLGDESERAAICHGLSFFELGAAIKQIALMTGRTNSVSLFSSLAHGNPYPVAWYSDDEFNQLVLKSLFIGIGIAPVEGLDTRTNPRLSAMCEDYIDERNDAGRSIPADIWLALLPYASARGEAMTLSALGHNDPEQRYYTAMAVGRCLADKPEFRQTLEYRLRRENISEIVTLLEQLLSSK